MTPEEQVRNVGLLLQRLTDSMQAGWGGVPATARCAKLETAKQANRLLGYMDAMEHAGRMPKALSDQLTPLLESYVEEGEQAIEELETERCDLQSRLEL